MTRQNAMAGLIRMQAAVREALQSGMPVVALESTLIAHGMPWPANLDAGQRIEEAVMTEGAVPATIAIMDGALRVGLDADAMERIARLGPAAAKCSRRDIAAAVRSGGIGATTVSASTIVACAAGIRIFATGGIGGVHRGAAESFDISADLPELARTPVAVVCAGPKAILDIPRTCEYLETLGVPIIGFRTDEVPAFYARQSGCPVGHRADEVREIAELLRLQFELRLGGALVVNPVPEAFALDPARIEDTIAAALSDAAREGISGHSLTPFLLSRIERLTGGRSLETNIALVVDNAKLGARIAAALAETENGKST